MPSVSLRVSSSRRPADDLPDDLVFAIALLTALREAGVFKDAQRDFRLDRRCGASTGLDLLVFLVCLFATPGTEGIRPFYESVRRWGPQLAAFAGRRRLASSSTVSRCLDGPDPDQADALAQWLLKRSVLEPDLVHDPGVLCHDTLGEAWHLFDYDPTVTAFRRRALPEGDDLPEPRRRTDGLAVPGYPGRKRGDVQLSRATLQHAGSGLWVCGRTAPGNGSSRTDVPHALRALVTWCEHLSVDPARAVFRSDGGNAGVPALQACKDAGVRYLFRIARYQLLDDPSIRDSLRSATWEEVEDAMCGPRRYATDLGVIALVPSGNTARGDGSPWPTVATRVVVCRSVAAAGSTGAGTVRGGWRHELFATDLPDDAFPAAEVVTAYYGRCGQENRFAQEDRELGLDHIFSGNPGGQQLAVAVGLFVWNARICLGARRLVTSPSPVPPTRPRDVRRLPSEQAGLPPIVSSGDRPTDPVGAPEPEAPPVPAPAVHRASLPAVLATVDWDKALRRRPGFEWDARSQTPSCPDGKPMGLRTFRVLDGSKVSLVWRARKASCAHCPIRSSCTSSTARGYRRELGLTVTAPDDLVTLTPPPPQAPPPPSPYRPPRGAPPGPHEVRWPTLAPAALRQASVEPFAGARARVSLELGPREAPAPTHLNLTSAQRQHRRKTWTERHEHNALPAGTKLSLQIVGGPANERDLRVALGMAATHRDGRQPADGAAARRRTAA